jgi:hypothetical protein
MSIQRIPPFKKKKIEKEDVVIVSFEKATNRPDKRYYTYRKTKSTKKK